jgi:hypothetical protein
MNIDSTREKSSKKALERAEMDDLDVYMEKLYEEDVDIKLEGARKILLLAEYAGNIESLVQNESLMVSLI